MEFRKIDLRGGGEPLTIPIPHSYKDCAELVRSDWYRLTGRRASLLRMWVGTWRNHCFRYNFWLRLSAHRGVLYVFCKWMLRRCSLKHGLWISSETAVGYGLYIGHGCGTIVNPTAVIGNNVNLSYFPTT